MHSIKLKLTNPPDLESYFREFGKLKRIAYNRFRDGIDKVNVIRWIKANVKTSFDSKFIVWASCEAEAALSTQRELGIQKIIFGSKKNFEKLRKGEISKEDWLKFRNPSLYAVGACEDVQGNRKFRMDIENQKFFFHPSKSTRFELGFVTNPKMKKRLKRFETMAKNNKLPITYRLTRTHIILSIDETRLAEPKQQIENRVLGIDLNPNYIGVSISDCSQDNQTIVHHQIFNLKSLNECSTNKKKYEQIEIAKSIANLAQHYQVSTVGVEKLEIQATDHAKGKSFNRMINGWDRNTVLNNLSKRCGFLGIRFQEAFAAYSSFVGCLRYPTEIDSVAASLEIARRASLFIDVYVKKILPKETKIVFPEWKDSLLHRWKERQGSGKPRPEDWKSAWKWFKKNPDFRYRVLIGDVSHRSFRSKSKKTKVFICFD